MNDLLHLLFRIFRTFYTTREIMLPIILFHINQAKRCVVVKYFQVRFMMANN
jgi:hypothetical protein